jgi:hypothetical protein
VRPLVLLAGAACALGLLAGGTAGAAGWWKPPPGSTLQVQFDGDIDQSVQASVYDLDAFDTDAATVSSLHGAGRHVVCYVDAGTWEKWRPDAGLYPKEVKGKANGWPGERWLDVRRLDVLGPILGARLDLCAAKGFDAVEYDNVDGYANRTGFDLTAADQLTFDTWLADAAHARGLGVGLKNDLDQVPQLVSSFDFSIDEQCAQYKECDALSPFVAAGKPVFEIEYKLKTSRFCAQAAALGFAAMRKRLSLDAWRQPCPG